MPNKEPVLLLLFGGTGDTRMAFSAFRSRIQHYSAKYYDSMSTFAASYIYRSALVGHIFGAGKREEGLARLISAESSQLPHFSIYVIWRADATH